MPPEAVRSALQRVLASPEFARAARMARFLRFAVEEALAGRGAQLKEPVIGVEVFDRAPGYDTGLDPIVRVEARRLRAKLDRYYRDGGGLEPLRIELPTGSYLPRFRPAPDGRLAGLVVVVPFAALSSDAESACFGGGLTEQVIHALTRVEGLRVVAGTAAGAPLPAARLIEGSVRRAGSTWRIAARLVRAGDRVVLWSEVYERAAAGAFHLQDEIAAVIAARAAGCGIIDSIPEASSHVRQHDSPFQPARPGTGGAGARRPCGPAPRRQAAPPAVLAGH